jgi:molybdate transport system substrate-binding protein
VEFTKSMNDWLAACVAAITVVIVITVSEGTSTAMESEVVVFAAASTTNALTEIGQAYATDKLGHIKTSFASSSTLAKQIGNGAPADLYLSANQKWMDYLEEKNLLVKGSRVDLLSNRIVLIAPVDSSIKTIKIVAGFSLTDYLGTEDRFAMGDPEHVPAGMYGQQALENLGVWNEVKQRVAPMKDVRAALVLVERAEAPLGLVYATDAAISKKVRVVGTFPPQSHPPIVYPVAVVAGGKRDAAAKFLNFLKTPAARAVFVKYGFKVK